MLNNHLTDMVMAMAMEGNKMETIKLDDEDFGQFKDLMEEYDQLIDDYKKEHEEIAIHIEETLEMNEKL